MDRPRDIFDEPPSDPMDVEAAPLDLELTNPFQKRSALRRSPPPGTAQVQAQQPAQFEQEAQIDPFKRGGLRRSGAGIPAPTVQIESLRMEHAPVVEEERANPFEKGDLRRSDARTITESMVAMPPAPPQVEPRVQPRQIQEQEQQLQLEPKPVRQPRRSIAMRQQSLPSATTTPAPERLSNVTLGSAEDPVSLAAPIPAAPTPEMVEEVNARAALRNQRLRGAQTRSPGQVDFGFNIPTAAPRPAPSPLAQVSAPNPTPAAPIESVAATPVVAPSPAAPSPAISQFPAPFVAPTPTPPTIAMPAATDSPLFVSRNTNSPLPALESSMVATPTPAPAPRQRTSRASEKQPVQPERGRQRMSELEPEEPEEPTLPPTPKQRGIDDPTVTTKPTGIHDTPSKRLKRRTVHHFSPLKPRAERLSSRSGAEDEAEEEPASKRQRPEPPSRFTQPMDPDAEKKKKRERMLKEILQLESDIRLAERENERVRKATEAGKELKRPANADALIEMLSRVMDKPATFDSKPKNPPTILDNVNLFLPFSRPAPPEQKSIEEIVKSEDLPSVLPVEVENPMPFLSVFTPFKFSSTVMTLPPTPGAETGEADILQLHSIATSAPHCLFSSKLSVTVNTKSGAVERCDVEYLDPAAERELGPWVRQRAKDGVLGRDINSICWASTQWYEAALRRARFFCAVEAELGNPAGHDKARRRLRQEARRGRKSQPGVPQAPEEHFEDEERKFSSEDLRRNMGRERMEIGVQGATLVVSWRMEFDWTGEAEQTIEAVVKTSRRCKCFSVTKDRNEEKLIENRA